MSRPKTAQAVSRDRLWELYWASPEHDHLQELVKSYESFVAAIAWKFCPSPEFFEDYKQEGFVGLVEAIQRFRQDHSAEFTTYASYRVVGSIKDYKRSQGWGMHLARSEQQAIMHLRDAEDRFFTQHGRLPSTDQELADFCRLPLIDVITTRAMQAQTKLMSIDVPLAQDDDKEIIASNTIADRVIDPLGAFEFSELKPIFDQLAPNEKIILAMNVLEATPLKEISFILGLSEARISQLKTRALDILRQGLEMSPRARRLFAVFLEDREQVRLVNPNSKPTTADIDLVQLLRRVELEREQPTGNQSQGNTVLLKGDVLMNAATTKQSYTLCHTNAFIVAALLWWKIPAEVTQAGIDYTSLYKEAGLQKPEPYIVSNAIARLKSEGVIIATGRCTFRRGANATVKFSGESIEPFPKIIPGFKVNSGEVFDLAELAERMKRRGAPAPTVVIPPPTPTPKPETPPAPHIQKETQAQLAAVPTASGNGKTHHLPELDYTSLALRAKAEGLRAQAQQLVEQAETLEEAARIKEIFDKAKAIMEGV